MWLDVNSQFAAVFVGNSDFRFQEVRRESVTFLCAFVILCTEGTVATVQFPTILVLHMTREPS